MTHRMTQSAEFGHFGEIPSAKQLISHHRARSSMDRAPDYGSGGYRFNSCRAHQTELARAAGSPAGASLSSAGG